MAHRIAPVAAALLVAVPATAWPSADELEHRKNLQLELRLDGALRDLHVEPRNAAVPAFGLGLLASGGAVWVASETDARGTWAVILGHLAAGALTDAAILAATPDPARACVPSYRKLPSDTPEALAHRVAVGERCLEAAAQREASLRLARAFRTAALGAATVALWGTEPKPVRDETLLWIAGADGVFALFQFFPGNAERALDDFREEKAAEVRLAPNPILDTAGHTAPGLGLVIRL